MKTPIEMAADYLGSIKYLDESIEAMGEMIDELDRLLGANSFPKNAAFDELYAQIDNAIVFLNNLENEKRRELKELLKNEH